MQIMDPSHHFSKGIETMETVRLFTPKHCSMETTAMKLKDAGLEKSYDQISKWLKSRHCFIDSVHLVKAVFFQ